MPDGIMYILLLIAGGVAAIVLGLTLNQSRLLYYPDLPSREIVATPHQIGLAYEPVTLVTLDGLRLDGWFVPARQQARGVALFFHGNAGNISHRLDSLQVFHELGLSTLIFDYRGYGRSDGAPSEEGTYRDAEATWRYLIEERRIPAQSIVVFGRSLGAAIAAYLASRHTPGALILESGFTSVPDMAAETYPWLPARRLTRFSYDTEAYLATVACPVLIVHSRNDEIIPFAHGQRLYAAARGPKQFLELRGGHNDGFLVSRQTYMAGLDAFLSAHLGNPQPQGPSAPPR